MKKIERIAPGGYDPSSRRKLNEIIDALPSLKILRTADIDVDHTANGTFIRPKTSQESTDTNNNAPRWG